MTPVSTSVNYAAFTQASSPLTLGTSAGDGCALVGIFVSSSSSGTITITDGNGGATIVPVFTGVAGTFYPLPFRANKNLYLTFGGSITGSVAWTAG